MLVILFTILLSSVIGVLYLQFFKKSKFVQPIYEDAPESHMKKAGTPTMGAIIFLVPYLLMSIYALFMLDINVLAKSLLVVIPFLFMCIGFIDDIGKILHKSNTMGLSAKSKLLCQVLVSLIVVVFLYAMNFSTAINFIFFTIDFGIFYYVIIVLMIVGFSNASNLTDGLDGLLSSVTIVLFSGIAFVVYLSPELHYLNYYIITIIASLLVYLLFFNKYPAKSFMGDTGSLTIGAMFILFLIFTKTEFIGVLFAFIYLYEVISVMIQTTYFKYTKKKFGEGKRIFLMTPVHHHYEKKGLSENKIVLLFSFIQLIGTVCYVLISLYIK